MFSRLSLLILLFFCFSLPAAAAEFNGVVKWVYDGDTLRVEGVGKVRLLGIDTPETEDSHRDDYYRDLFHIKPQQLRRIARQAKDYAIKLSKGQKVHLETDREERDQYQRLLAYVYLADGRLLNRLMLEKGLAAVFRRYDFQRKSDFLAVESRARSERLGLWQTSP